MQKVKEIVGSILKDHAVDTVYFVGCGGSLAGFFPAKYFLSCEAAKLKVGYINANEFVHATPKEIGPGAVVILASQRGNTPETVKACQVAREKGAATVGLTFQVFSMSSAMAPLWSTRSPPMALSWLWSSSTRSRDMRNMTSCWTA